MAGAAKTADSQLAHLPGAIYKRAMQVRELGQTGVPVSSVILGCGTFGGIGGVPELVGRGLDRDSAMRTMDEASALGIGVFDTANRYSGGASERLVGEWLRARPRSLTGSVHVATKVAPPQVDGVEGRAFDGRWIEERLSISLDRLGTERVTFLLSHAPDRQTPVEITLEGFAAVLESGRADCIGCCNVGARELVAALDAAARLGLPEFAWVQNSFSLLTPRENREVRAVCRDRGLGYTPYSPLAGGVLTGKYRRGEPFPEGTRLALRPEGQADLMTGRIHDALDILRRKADTRGVSPAALALAWVLHHPDCAAAVVGPSRDAPHLGHVSEALDLAFDDELHAALTAAFAPD